jgi:hypothetical protein
VALTIKLSLPLLALPLVLAAVRPRALANWACLAAGALLLFSLTFRVQIGIRLVLPLVGLAAVGLAGALVTACRDASVPPWRRRLLTGGAVGGVAWVMAAAVAVWPQGLCYTNELWGGTGRGYLRLSDSNYDWGQGLKELARWERRQGLDRLDVWYYGSDPAVRRAPLHEVPLHALPVRRPEDVAAWVRGPYLAVSTSLLYGMGGESESLRHAGAVLRSRTPAARTTTFFIYDFTEEGRGQGGN